MAISCIITTESSNPSTLFVRSIVRRIQGDYACCMKPEPPVLDINEAPALGVANQVGIPTSIGWKSPALLLMLMAAAMQLSFASWSALQYNFAHEMLGFTGREIGI